MAGSSSCAWICNTFRASSRLKWRRLAPTPARYRCALGDFGSWLGIVHREPTAPLGVRDERRAELRIVREARVVGGEAHQRHEAMPLLGLDREPSMVGEHILVAAQLIGVASGAPPAPPTTRWRRARGAPRPRRPESTATTVRLPRRGRRSSPSAAGSRLLRGPIHKGSASGCRPQLPTGWPIPSMLPSLSRNQAPRSPVPLLG